MARILYDALNGLNGVSLDNHTLQSILDSTTLPTADPPTTITLDEDDVFLCGKCKKQFTSFSLFMCHKKEHNADNCQESASCQQLDVQALDSSLNTYELCQPIVLSEEDILSFNIENEEDVLSIPIAAQATSSMSNAQDGSSFLATNVDSSNSMKQLVEAIPITNKFDVTSHSGEPIVLTPEPLQNSFTSSLPSVESVTSGKFSSTTTVSCGKSAAQNINILAACPERQPKNCKVLLPNIDYFEEDVEDGTLLFECDDTIDQLLQYGNGSINSDGTVLLDYCEADAKTCEVLLRSGESIGYIDSTNQICEYSSFSGTSENMPTGRQENVSVDQLDVIDPSDCSSAALEFSKAVNEAVNTQEISEPERCFAIAVQELSNCAVTDITEITELLPEITICESLANECGTSDQPNDGQDSGQVASVEGPKLNCRFCDKKFAKNFDLEQHQRSHTGEKPFQCVVCGRAFAQKSNVKKHMSTHKVWPTGFSRTLPKEPLQLLGKHSLKEKKKNGSSEDIENNESDSIIIVDRSYVCQYCNTSFTTYLELKTHMKKHSHQKVYKCIQNNCQKTFVDLDSFVNHTASHTDELQYCCHVCLKEFNSLVDLSIHQRTHTLQNRTTVKNPRYYRCIKCKSKFTSSKALEHHLSTTNHNFPCTHCGRIFTCERYLRRHLRTHGTPKSFVCPTCNKGFRTEQYLNVHRLIHTGVKPYTCMHCPAAFNRKDKLVRHNLIHDKVKKLKCPFHNYLGCSKEFNRQDKLKRHILTHGIKPFHCEKCNRVIHEQIQREHDLNYHVADAPFSCSRCGLRFQKKFYLSIHICEAISEDTHSKTTPKVARTRKFKKTRSKKCQPSSLKDTRRESYQFILPRVKNSEAGEENKKYPGSVPTLEIILVRHEKEGENDVYHVMFPTASGGELQTKVVQKHHDVLNNSSKGIPDGNNGQAVIAGVNVVNKKSGT